MSEQECLKDTAFKTSRPPSHLPWSPVLIMSQCARTHCDSAISCNQIFSDPLERPNHKLFLPLDIKGNRLTSPRPCSSTTQYERNRSAHKVVHEPHTNRNVTNNDWPRFWADWCWWSEWGWRCGSQVTEKQADEAEKGSWFAEEIRYSVT